MTRTVFPLPARLLLLIALTLLGSGNDALAQFTVHPSLGLQTMWFNGDYPVKQPISPGLSRDLPLGGGMMSSNNGLRLQAELIPVPEGMIRFPLSFEYYDLTGKTTFSASNPSETRKKRWLFLHSGSMISAGLGATASFFTFPSLYVSAEGKFNYIFPTTLTSRIYYVDNDETVLERSVHPDSLSESRFGLYMRVGTQLDFFEPFLLDVSLGYGLLNIGGKNTDPATQRNLLVVDNQRHDPEETIGYIGIGFSLIWKP
jgi:hypothetical protein